MAGGAAGLVAGRRDDSRAGAAKEAVNRMGVRLCRERSAIAAPRLPIADPAVGFSTDGFHASEAGYRAWAEHLVDLMLADH